MEIPRRLYEHGFEGWDVSQGCYVTDYLIMAVGIACALIAHEKVRRATSWATLWGLMCQFSIFSLLQGVGAGFRGVAHHILDTYLEDGAVMGRTWGAPHAEWLFAWLMAIIVLPLASSACLGTSLAYGEFGIGWIQLVKFLGLLVVVLEMFLCLSNQIDSSGALTVYWGIITSSIACFAVFRRGCKVPGLCMIFLGTLMRVVGYMVLVTAPASCKTSGIYRVNCPYPEEFNHNAFCHLLIAASVLAFYCGVDAKYTRDQEIANWELLQAAQKSKSPQATNRMCALAW
mmetsp:Transcript_55608/g.141389  ORF Transcript_55608/g.141389 Transcript_55608/m.141389 type:complete len:287 (-) Transcript_55608:152-1012(-)